LLYFRDRSVAAPLKLSGVDDTLLIVMKNPSFKSNPITGQDARNDVDALHAVHVHILWKKSKKPMGGA
jgi:hypothetical protein